MKAPADNRQRRTSVGGCLDQHQSFPILTEFRLYGPPAVTGSMVGSFGASSLASVLLNSAR
jgi:hypothetical protein